MTEAEELAHAEKLGRETASFASYCIQAKEYYLAKHTDKAMKVCEKAEGRYARSKSDNTSLTKLMGVKAYEIFLKYMR